MFLEPMSSDVKCYIGVQVVPYNHTGSLSNLFHIVPPYLYSLAWIFRISRWYILHDEGYDEDIVITAQLAHSGKVQMVAMHRTFVFLHPHDAGLKMMLNSILL